MLFDDAAFVRIDPTAGDRPLHYVALDSDLRLVILGQGTLEEVLAFVAGWERAVVAVDAPQSPNRGLMLRPETRQRFNLDPHTKTWGRWKVCEYELRRRNIRLYNTPEDETQAPRWIRTGFALYRRLQAMGFRFYQPGEEIGPRVMLEVHPHACFAVLLGRRSFLKQTLEGRLQRQLVLYLKGLDISDPLKALEEITRHHLLSGDLPLRGLLAHDELDALVAAYTAYLVACKPERTSQVGDREEGCITLPAAQLKDFYP